MGAVDLTDAVRLLGHLFESAGAPTCAKSADANDDGSLNVTDAVWMLLHAFAGMQSLPQPFGQCGVDTTTDELSCEDYASCP